MYTYIDTKHGLWAMAEWLKLHKHELPPNFPTEVILAGLQIVMTNNVFAFGNTYWLQACGTAMGTIIAVIYATIYYSLHEELCILPPGEHQNLILYHRFIDDAFSIILFQQSNTYNKFKETMNDYGNQTH